NAATWNGFQSCALPISGSTYTNPTSPGNPRGNPQPNYRLNRQSPGQNWDQIGPVGERGDLASISTYESRIIPGKVAPSEQYRGTESEERRVGEESRRRK